MNKKFDVVDLLSFPSIMAIDTGGESRQKRIKPPSNPTFDPNLALYPLDYSNVYSGLVVEVCRILLHFVFLFLSIWPISKVFKGFVAALDLVALYYGYGMQLALFLILLIYREVSNLFLQAVSLIQGIFHGCFVMPWKMTRAILELFVFVSCIGLPIVMRARRLYGDNKFLEKDIVYDEENGASGAVLDVYYMNKKETSSGEDGEQNRDSRIDKKSVIVFFQGGNWSSCKKEHYVALGRSLQAAGFVTVIPNFSVSNVHFMIRDICNVLLWTRENIEKWGGDCESIYIIGHSTGFHLLLASLLREFLKKDSSAKDLVPYRKRSQVLGSITHMIGISGIYDLWALTKTLEATGKSSFLRILDLFQSSEKENSPIVKDLSEKTWKDAKEQVEAYSPINMIQELGKSQPDNLFNLPPITFIHGTGDKTSSFQHAETISLLLTKFSKGTSGRLILYDRASHLEPIVEWLDGSNDSRTRSDIERIIFACEQEGSDFDSGDLMVDIDGGTEEEKFHKFRGHPAAIHHESYIWQLKKFFLRHICPM